MTRHLQHSDMPREAGEGCGQECLVQPNFFCGQLLTDADLNQLLHWTEAKFRLQRTRSGWGVVCGLQISLDPAHPTRVIVQPGQAIDRCGRDLLLCEPLSHDLADACLKEECLEPAAFRLRFPARGRAAEELAVQEAAGQPFPASGLLDSAQLDLYLHYSTIGLDPQPALRSDACGRVTCGNSRIRETVALKTKPAEEPLTTAQRRYEDFVDSFTKLHAANLALIESGAGKTDPKPWLQERLEARPMRQFGFVHEWVKNASRDDLNRDLNRILSFMTIDALLTWLRSGCPGCSPDEGVHIGRAWLAGPNPATRSTCRVLMVDSHPPYVDEVHSDPKYPVIPGCHNLAPYLWQEWNTVLPALQRDGVAFSEEVIDMPGDTASLARLYAEMNLITDCSDDYAQFAVRAFVADLGEPFGERVIGFGGPAAGQEQNK